MFPVYEEKKENLHLHSRIARHESQLNSSILQKDVWSLEWARNSFTWRKVILQSFFRK